MTILEDRSRTWQGEGGSEQWRAAWDRVRELLAPVWTDAHFRYEHDAGRGVRADGAAAAATALYLVAAETGTDPADVRRDHVEDLLWQGSGETVGDVVHGWEQRLSVLGHDPADGTDPVSVRWRVLRTDNSPDEGIDFLQDDLVDGPLAGEDVPHRQGYGLIEGLGYVLSPALSLTF